MCGMGWDELVLSIKDSSTGDNGRWGYLSSAEFLRDNHSIGVPDSTGCYSLQISSEALGDE